MPAYAGDGRQIWQIVAHVQSLSVGKGATGPRATRLVGRAFSTEGCGRCHTVAERGETLGPDLTDIGSRRSLGSLRRSVLDPNEEVSADYWTRKASTKAGQRISGIRLNEDTHSYQYRDKTGLRSVLKTDLAEFEILKTSPMPSYRGKLNDRDLEDLIAYLAARREGSRPMKTLACLLIPVALAHAQVSFDRLLHAAQGTAELADLFRQREPALTAG